MAPNDKDLAQYKQALLKAAAENKVTPLRPFLEEGGLQWEDVRNRERQNVLHIAALEGSEDVVQAMLAYQRVTRRIDMRDRASRTPLHLAAAMGFESVARQLVKAKASLEEQDDEGCTPLHLAVKFDWGDTTRALLELGADPLAEDCSGFNSVDTANVKEDTSLSMALAGFQGQRKKTGVLEDLKRRMFPGWRPRPPPRSFEQMAGALEHRSGSQGDDGSPAPDTIGATPPARDSREQAEEAHADDLEWGGLDDIVLKDKDGKSQSSSRASKAPQKQPQLQKSASSSAAKSRDDTMLGTGGWWRQAVAEHLSCTGPAPGTGLSGSRVRANSAPIAPRGGSTTSSAAASAWGGHGPSSAAAASPGCSPASLKSDTFAEFAMFRLQMYFDATVQRLEFEVEWKDEQPSVGNVKPGGEAARRGILRGDRIISIGGILTSGKGRDELLPALKGRPLMLKVDREARIEAKQDPHLELDLPLRGSEFREVGAEVAWCGKIPIVSAIRQQSKAWAAGWYEGDGIVRVNGRNVTKSSRANLLALLQDSPQSVTIWRRPLGMDLHEPWTVQVP